MYCACIIPTPASINFRRTLWGTRSNHSRRAARRAVEHGLNSVEVRVKGPGAGRENAIRALLGAGLRIVTVSDRSPIPHNGCRAPKRRRV